MSESESLNYKIEQSDWQELRRTMECISDKPFQIIFIKGNENNDYFYPRSEMTQSENSTQSNLTTSSLKTANDGYDEHSRNLNKKKKLGKIPLCNRARHLQSNNIAQLNSIFNTDTKKTKELSSRCKKVINQELMFWYDRIEFEMKQTNAIMVNLCARMKRIRRLNRMLRDLLTNFKDDMDSSLTSSIY
ncbi:hypothetical protein X798_06613 [Onchocerca flexuosa]|uniref:Uncharacterized protein n=1 Tax=Onchocerca flexuosa TaxID=387005 RepID=A0A238BLS6_9BILA|nr:hypothetical protein X798_06613 [Onchocerca flexuosa]